MKINVKVITQSKQQAVINSLTDLTKLQVYVGIPEAHASRMKGPITNAQLAFIHTHGVNEAGARKVLKASMAKGNTYGQALALYMHSYGAPPQQIPARPIIEPAIEEKQNREIIVSELKLAAQYALEGKSDQVMRHLNRAGMLAQNIVRGWFTDPRNGWPPNAPSTIRRKGSDRPLIDTGELRKAITFVVAHEK